MVKVMKKKIFRKFCGKNLCGWQIMDFLRKKTFCGRNFCGFG